MLFFLIMTGLEIALLQDLVVFSSRAEVGYMLK